MGRRLAACAFSALLAIVGLGATAAPASAQTISVTATDCSQDTDATISAAPGDTVSITGSLDNCRALYVARSIVAGSSSITAEDANGPLSANTDVPQYWYFTSQSGITEATIALAPTASGVVSGAITLTNGLLGGYIWAVALGDGSGGSSSGSIPAPVIQQFERDSSETCEAGQPDGLNWGGSSSGGWSQSWAQWPGNGAGGFVCSRTLTYNPALGHWVSS